MLVIWLQNWLILLHVATIFSTDNRSGSRLHRHILVHVSLKIVMVMVWQSILTIMGKLVQYSWCQGSLNHGNVLRCWKGMYFNALRPRQNGRHFADDTFKYMFLNENIIISAKILLKFVPKDPINNIPALVQIMAWRRQGDKPLSEPMMVRLLTHICVTRPQYVNEACILTKRRATGSQYHRSHNLLVFRLRIPLLYATQVIPVYSYVTKYNTLRPSQNCRHFADGAFKRIFWKSAEVLIMAWCHYLNELRLILRTYLYVTRRQW